MKNLLFALLFFGSILSANAQFLNWGVKAGLNYNANGDLFLVYDDVISDPFSSDQELGYHFGLLAEIKLPLFLYIRPELLYTHTESSYPIEDGEAKLTMDRVDVPVLLGFRVLKIGRFFLGSPACWQFKQIGSCRTKRCLLALSFSIVIFNIVIGLATKH